MEVGSDDQEVDESNIEADAMIDPTANKGPTLKK